MKETMWFGILLTCITFFLTVSAESLLVPWLKKRRAGQPILEIGPSWHLAKAGTPTLGGIGFILAVVLCACILTRWSLRNGTDAWQRTMLLVGFAVSCGGIGFFDDWCKLRRRENKGLSAWQKYILQLIVSAIFLLLAVRFFDVKSMIVLPFTDKSITLGVFYYPFALLYLTGLINALNLTDGVDGLLSSTTAVFSLFLLACGVADRNGDALVTGAMLLGATLGFLCFNFHPAEVFMGDTGSLFLGAMIAGYGILSASPLGVLLGGGVFVAEAVSVIVQVIYFKCSKGKRLLRMAPLHHHFEKCGWSEVRVVGIFSLAAAFLAVLAFLGR